MTVLYVTLFRGMASQKWDDWSKEQVFPASPQMSIAITFPKTQSSSDIRRTAKDQERQEHQTAVRFGGERSRLAPDPQGERKPSAWCGPASYTGPDT